MKRSLLLRSFQAAVDFARWQAEQAALSAASASSNESPSLVHADADHAH